MTDAQWLNDEEQRLWRLILQSSHRIHRSIDETLQSGEGITAPEFSVLVALSEHPEQQMRLKELCNLLEWDRSRTSHQITRMERRGLVTKNRCSGDARGVIVALTEDGLERIIAAAPGHVDVVRKIIFDHLRAEDVPALTRFFQGVLDVEIAQVQREF